MTYYVVQMFRPWADAFEPIMGLPAVYKGTPGEAGFLPVYETAEDALRDYPTAAVVAIAVGTDGGE